MPVLYVVEQGAEVGKSGDSLVVRKEEHELQRVPLHRVTQVVLFGGVQITAAAVDELLDRGIDVAYLSIHGKFKGRLQPAFGKNIVLRRAQFRRADDPAFCLGFARAIARGKLTNQAAACRRWERQRGIAPVFAQEVDRALGALPSAATRDEIMGFEGTGARQYYQGLRLRCGRGLEFPKRTRRPPTDPMSLLLSLASALLQTQVHAAASLVGFDPFLGFFHVEKYGWPALVLDLMEEFRPLISDATAVAAVNVQVVKAGDFVEDASGALVLPESGVEAFVRLFDRRLRDEVQHPTLNQTSTYRQWIEFQARMAAQTALGELLQYCPFMPGH